MSSAPSPAPPLPAATGTTLRRGMSVVMRGVREQPRWFALAVLGSTVYGILTGLMAWAIGWCTSTIVSPAVAAKSVTSSQLWTIAGVISGVVTVNVLGIILRRTAAGFAMYNLGAAYRRRVSRQYLDLPLRWHHKHPSGQLLSNANADVEATWNIFAPLPMALGVIVMLLFGAVQMFVVDPVLAAVGLVVFPLLFLANAVFQRRMSPLITRAQQLRAEVSEVAHESFEAALVVKSMGREDQEAQRFAQTAYTLRDANILVGRTRGTFDPAIESIPTIGTLAVIAVGAWRAGQGAVTAAEVVQIAYLFSVLAFPVRAFGWVLGELPRSVVLGAGRRCPAGDRRDGLRSGPPARSRGRHDRGPTTRLRLRDRPARGGHRAVPGDPRRHHHRARRSDDRVCRPDWLGQDDPDQPSVTPRRPRLGAGAHRRRRPAYGAPGWRVSGGRAGAATDLHVRGHHPRQRHPRRGAHRRRGLAGPAGRPAQRFVRALPDGLDTKVGERGTNLSGGQRQRVALARAVIRRPQLLVLDDATSAVDPSVEQEILSALRGVSSATTVLLVAYRMATIALADEIVYIEGGQVRGHGSHDVLVATCPGYAALVSAYAREAADRAAVAADEEVAS